MNQEYYFHRRGAKITQRNAESFLRETLRLCGEISLKSASALSFASHIEPDRRHEN
jgi:hypothetical protein